MKWFVTIMIAATAKAAASKFFLAIDKSKETGAYSQIFLFLVDVLGGMTFAVILTNLIFFLWSAVIRFEKIRSSMRYESVQ